MMMMLQPTSGRKGFDFVKDPNGTSSSSSRPLEADPSTKSAEKTNKEPGNAPQQAIIRQTTDAIKSAKQ